VKEMSVYPAGFSELRRMTLSLGTFPESALRSGMLFRLDATNGGVAPIFGTGTNRPSTDALGGVNNLYGVSLNGADEINDPVYTGLPDYAGQQHVKRISVAVCVPHREIVVFPINKSTGEIDYSQAVASNIGRPVGIYYRDVAINVDGTNYWVHVGGSVGGSETGGYVVGITRDKRLIVRIVRNKWAELA
jgi:hypothetical protein